VIQVVGPATLTFDPIVQIASWIRRERSAPSTWLPMSRCMGTQADPTVISPFLASDAVDEPHELDASSDVPHERTFREAMERIAVLHQAWIDTIALFGAASGDGASGPAGAKVVAAA